MDNEANLQPTNRQLVMVGCSWLQLVAQIIENKEVGWLVTNSAPPERKPKVNRRKPTPRSLDAVADRVKALPAPLPKPYAHVTEDYLADPLKRFSSLVTLSEWSSYLDAELSPDPAAEIAELAEAIREIRFAPIARDPEPGPLLDEILKARASLERASGERYERSTKPLNHDPGLIDAATRMSFRMFTVNWIADGRHGAEEANAKSTWHRDPRNMSVLAEPLGYSVR